jgi:uncharacterized SAM-binding protein YcdF (DUF218 family)
VSFFISFAKQYVHIDSILTILTLVGSGFIWIVLSPGSRAARRCLGGVLLAYWVVSTPLGSRALVATLDPGFKPLETAPPGVDTVVVLGGGAETFVYSGMSVSRVSSPAVFRALEAARVFKQVHARVVIASGGIYDPARQVAPESRLLSDTLIELGIPPSAIVLDSNSRTTYEQAKEVERLLPDAHRQPFVLVTSATHMRRALAAFKAVGLSPIPSVAPFRSERDGIPPALLPDQRSLLISDMALYDWAAWFYYRLSGRLSETGPS